MPIIQTTAGPITGTTVLGGLGSRRIHYFGGVPYATAGRFEAPGPAAPWTDRFAAVQPGAAPPQRADDPPIVPGLAAGPTSEACLTAEIWTPSPAGKRAVVMWIPGGAFRTGSAGLPVYDGRHLAADGGVVVIGVNYRLGALGFLAADGVPSNLGLRDLLAAIDWVRANAEAFGGDPDRITLMGESAGAGAITHLLTRPDLPVAGAIVLSGSATLTLDESTAQKVAQRLIDLAGVADVAELRTLELDRVLDAQDAAVTELAATVGAMPLHPWVDGDIVPIAPLDAAAADRLAAVPLVIGTTAQEMDLYRATIPAVPAEYAVRMLQHTGAPLGLTEEQVRAGYAACGDDLVTAIGDVTLQLPARLIAESHVRRGLPVWRSSFVWQAPGKRACHALDLPFLFGTLDTSTWREFAGADGDAAASADRLSDRMRHAWAAFATSGRPACAPFGVWPSADDGSVVELGPEIQAVTDPAAARVAAWR